MINLIVISSIFSLITIIILKVFSLKSLKDKNMNLFKDYYLLFFIFLTIVYIISILSVLTLILSLLIFIMLSFFYLFKKQKFKSLFYFFVSIVLTLCFFIPYNNYIVNYDSSFYKQKKIEASSYLNNNISYKNINKDMKDIYYYVDKNKQGWISITDKFDIYNVNYIQLLSSYNYRTNILLDYNKEFKYGYTIENKKVYILPYRIIYNNKTGYIITDGNEFKNYDEIPNWIKISPSKNELINLLEQKNNITFNKDNISVFLTKQNNLALSSIYQRNDGENVLIVLYNDFYVSEVEIGKDIKGEYFSIYSKNDNNFLITKDFKDYYLYDIKKKKLLLKGNLNNLLLSIL